jgi:hypothetical protein
MTRCIGSPAEEMAERYLAGGLPEQEAERFEDHYLGCDVCHEYLLTLKDIRVGLAREPIEISASAGGQTGSAAPKDKSGGSRLLMFPVQRLVWGSIAAALILGTIVVGVNQSTHIFRPGRDGAGSIASAKPAVNPNGGEPNASGEAKASEPGAGPGVGSSTGKSGQDSQNVELASLVDLRIPGYQQPQLRGGELADTGHVEFSAGMVAYTQGDCASALKRLAKVPATASDGVAARLYSGLCQLKGREVERAGASFTKVIAAGDTPQLETAEYFLTQTRLLRGDAAGAANWLNKTIALRGDYEERAEKQKALLPKTEQLPAGLPQGLKPQ